VPLPRPFAEGFDGCPGYQAVKFTAFDSHEGKLGTWSTCRHLASGAVQRQRGHFYAQCSLGRAEDRIRWVARVTTASLEVVRALQADFENISAPHWKNLLEAKRDVLSSPSKPGSRIALDHLLEGFHASVRGFLAERKQQLESVGLDLDAVMTLVEATSHAWARSSQVALKDPDPATLQSLAPEFQAFLGPPASTPWTRSGPEAVPLYEDSNLRITEPSPAVLRLVGVIDAGNVEAVSRALASVLRFGVDYHLDLSGLIFCDVGGLRAIVEATERLGAGSKLYIDNLPGHLARVANLAGWAGQPGVVLVPLEALPA